MLIRNAEVDGERTSVLVQNGVIAAMGPRLGAPAGSPIIDAGGGAVIPGLHDHHVHVMALVAARSSVPCGPPDVHSEDALRAGLLRADAGLAAGEWLRGVGFHESVHPSLDRRWLDDVLPHRPVRIQHRSGAQWILNSAALLQVGVDSLPVDSVERDTAGVPTGRLTGLDAVLRGRWPSTDFRSSVAGVGRELAGYGLTGLTDATPYDTAHGMDELVRAHTTGSVPQHLTVTGAPGLHLDLPAGLSSGPAKIVVGDHDLPEWDVLLAQVHMARQQGRTVAVHCVTRVGLVLTLAALDEVGTIPGDRIEHAVVVAAPRR